MQVIKARNPHTALPEAMYQLRIHREAGCVRESRNGSVIVAPTPVTTVYEMPTERVVFWPQRDANPFFHLFEALWMIGGRNDVDYVSQFVKRMELYSDDQETFNGAYGYRWRHHFKVALPWLTSEACEMTDCDCDQLFLAMTDCDQLSLVATALRENPDCRRQVVAMWDGHHDLGLDSVDLPCNTHIYFQRGFEGELNMTVCNRSNDVVWGCYGANAVHFSMLQEFMAAWIGCPVGRYYQVSNNWHGYTETAEPLIEALEDYSFPQNVPCPYETGEAKVFGLVNTPIDQWQRDLKMFLDEGVDAIGYKDKFFRRVAVPMLKAFRMYKEGEGVGRYRDAIGTLEMDCADCDWKLAAHNWLVRRWDNFLRKQNAEQK